MKKEHKVGIAIFGFAVLAIIGLVTGGGKAAPMPDTSDPKKPDTGKEHRGRDRTLLAAVITIVVTLVLWFGSSTAAGHGHDYDVKLQLVESISAAAANAVSTAQEISSGEIVHEATSPQSAAAVIQQRSDQARRDWQQEVELVQLQIDTYFPEQAKNKLNEAWANAEAMVEDLILISGQLDTQSERAQYVNSLRHTLTWQGFTLANQQWKILNQNPGCYVSKAGCSLEFHMAFTSACLKLVQDIQTYLLRHLTANIQNTDTIFQPSICTHTVICNLLRQLQFVTVGCLRGSGDRVEVRLPRS